MIIQLKGADFSAKNIGKIDIPSASVVALTIEGVSSVSGADDATTYKCKATFDDGASNYVSPNWAITAGGGFASISSDGILSVKSGASSSPVTISASYMSKNTVKNVTVTFDLNLLEATEMAIEASGNTAMTTSQKLSLDKFMRTVGAETEGSIWSKMKLSFMPVLANSVDKAMVNYSTNLPAVTLSGSEWQLRNKGVVGKLESMSGTTRLAITSPILAMSNVSIFAMTMETITSATYLMSYRGNSGNNRFQSYLSVTGGKKFYIGIPSPSATIYSNVIGQATDIHKLFGVSINGSSVSVIKDDGTFASATSSEAEASGTDTAVTNFDLLSTASGVGNTSSASSIGMMFIGNHLTNEEMTTLKNAAEELVANF